MLEALGWGAVAASSLLVGALLGLVRPWPSRAIGLVLGFGAGALISAVSFELAQEGVRIGGGGAVGIGLAVGALTYYVCDTEIERRSGGSDAGAGLALGAFLDGIPEQLVLGLGIALGDGVSAGCSRRSSCRTCRSRSARRRPCTAPGAPVATCSSCGPASR